jgi:hypothetical protein
VTDRSTRRRRLFRLPSAIIDADQRAIATFAGLTRDPQEFLRFLRSSRR